MFPVFFGALLFIHAASAKTGADLTFSTWNVNGLARWYRDKGDLVKQTFRKLLYKSDMLAVQEAAGIGAFYGPWARSYDLCNLREEPDRRNGARLYGQFAIFAKRKYFKILKAEPVPGRHIVGLRCVLEPKGEIKNQGSIIAYSLHLKAGNSGADAASRLTELKELIRVLKKDKKQGHTFLVMGDFNFNAKKDNVRDWKKLWKSVDVRFVPEQPRDGNHGTCQDQGQADQGFAVTTPGGGTYDAVFTNGILGQALRARKLRYMSLVPRRSRKKSSTDRETSDHLPVLADIRGYGKVVSYNIQNLQLKELLSNKQKVGIIQGVLGQAELVGVQEIRDKKAPGFKDRVTLLQTVFGNTSWAVLDQYACGARRPYSLVSSQLVDLNNDGRQGLLCRLKKPGKHVCVVNLHLKNKYSRTVDVADAVRAVHEAVTEDDFCQDALTVLLGDFNNELGTTRAVNQYQRVWPNLHEADCQHNQNQTWTYTAIDHKTKLDHILLGPPKHKRGKPDIHPETLVRQCSILTDLDGKESEYHFDTWLELSDHYPVMMYVKKECLVQSEYPRNKERSRSGSD